MFVCLFKWGYQRKYIFINEYIQYTPRNFLFFVFLIVIVAVKCIYFLISCYRSEYLVIRMYGVGIAELIPYSFLLTVYVVYNVKNIEKSVIFYKFTERVSLPVL